MTGRNRGDKSPMNPFPAPPLAPESKCARPVVGAPSSPAFYLRAFHAVVDFLKSLRTFSNPRYDASSVLFKQDAFTPATAVVKSPKINFFL